VSTREAADGSTLDLASAVAAALADDGPLARALHGFEPRHGQRAMAAAVSRVLEDGGILLAEAGTGTGKTLAYLVPAILNRRRALVSTGTKNLQEQIVQKDVPFLQYALGMRFTATCMKGRGNYLCLHRFDTFRAGPALRTAEDRRHLALIEAWAAETDTGDRAEVEDLPEDLSFWGDLAATTENCLGSDCPRLSDCFVTRMRQRAAESDLVVVNHHLLCADAALRQHSFGEVIPECSVAIVDEAHQLEDVATQYFGVVVSNHRLDELVRDGHRVLGARPVPDREKADDVRQALGRLADRGTTFFGELAARRPGVETRAQPTGGLFDERLRVTAELLDPVAESGLDVIGALDGVDAAIGLTPEASEDLRGIARRATEIRDALRFLLAAQDASFVYFLETRGRGIFLRAMPIDVSTIVRELLFDRMPSTVLTSATLAVNGRFDYVRGRLGVVDATEIRLPSEFDYARQSVLYLPRRMPDPRAPAFGARAADEVLDILGRTEGRAFVLFTSYATLRQVRARLEGAIPYPLLVQGDAPRSILLAQFRETPNSVLLATSSFWQGVDVAGDALSCVIIDKLPFASPSEPVVQARIEAITARGGDAFGEYQVPLAILTLLQGLGRLLRHRSDRGVLVILDPRLRTKGYGRRFLGSLPPSPITHDPGDITRFFERERT
jgi:ATP-dependent DNA helicase DinG